MNKERVEALNKIGYFLGARDLNNLSEEELEKCFDIKKVDILVLLGSAITYNIEVAIEAYKKGLCNKLLICGGIGHSTEFLRETVRNDERYKDIKFDNKAEADIIAEIIKKYFNLNEDDIIIENKSTNCGDNARKALELLDDLKLKYNSIMLIQDPTMQLRTYAAFLKYTKEKENITIINYSPFIPKVNIEGEFENKGINGIWTMDRYEDLIIGEIPRLRDDENGYGPRGYNFIEHIEIPNEIEESYFKLSNILGKKTR